MYQCIINSVYIYNSMYVYIYMYIYNSVIAEYAPFFPPSSLYHCFHSLLLFLCYYHTRHFYYYFVE